MNLFIEILVSLIISSVPFLIYFKSKDRNREKFILSILSSTILLIGCLIRMVYIEVYPIGLNQDEASIGYEAYSVLNYGIDRNGQSFPIHFIAWGSGQNALYGYFIMPFIKMFGVSNFSLRFPMALIGCITLLAAYFLFRKAFDDYKGVVMLFIIAIIPWHILKSRWGLESNLFPDLIFYALTLLYFGIVTNKRRYYILASVILGLATYSYGTSYLFVPVFLIITYLYLILIKKVTIKNGILYFCITGVISIPMILFVIINYFNLNTIKIFNITIPKLYVSRFMEITSVNGNFFSNCFDNFINSLKLFISQEDGLILNYLPGFGVLYKFSLPFILIGVYRAIVTKDNYLLKLNNILFASSVFLTFFVSPNINRINILWISIIIYLGVGIVCIYEVSKKYSRVILGIYFIAFSLFTYNYFTDYQNAIGNATFSGLEESIKYANKLEYNNLYITNSINQPYIYYLLYNEIAPDYYIKNREIPLKETMFQQVASISNVYFYLPQFIKKGNVYILENSQLIWYNLEEFEFEEFKNYSVIY